MSTNTHFPYPVGRDQAWLRVAASNGFKALVGWLMLAAVLAACGFAGWFTVHHFAPKPAVAPPAHYAATSAGVRAWEHRWGNRALHNVNGEIHAIRYDLSRYVRDTSSAGYVGGDLAADAGNAARLHPPVARRDWQAGMTRLEAGGNSLMAGYVRDGQILIARGESLLDRAEVTLAAQ